MDELDVKRENIKNARVVIDMPKIHIGLEPNLSEISPAMGANIITMRAGAMRTSPACIISMPRTIFR